MSKKKIMSVSCLLLLLCLLGGAAWIDSGAEGEMGENASCRTAFAFTDKSLLYLEDIEREGAYGYRGLYLKDCENPDAKETVISDRCGSSVKGL